MENLPLEIINNIFSRFPDFKPIGKCRCVSTLWRSTFSNIKTSPDLLLQFRNLSEDSGSRIYCLDDDNQASGRRPLRPSKHFDESYIMDSFHHAQPHIVGSCQGFVCMLCCHQGPTDWDSTNSAYIFNPITEERWALPTFTCRNSWKHKKLFSGFGFDYSNKVYKIVIIRCIAYPRDNELLVHTLGGTNWKRKYGVVPDDLLSSPGGHSSVVVNGSLHWITDKSFTASPFILSFNLSTEEFGCFGTPVQPLGTNYFRLGTLEERLSIVESVVLFRYEHYINVWVMEKYGVNESWVIKFRIGHELGYCDTPPLFIKLGMNGELLLPNNKCIVGYNTVTQKWRRLPLGCVGKPKNYALEVHPIVCSRIPFKEAFSLDCGTKELLE